MKSSHGIPLCFNSPPALFHSVLACLLKFWEKTINAFGHHSGIEKILKRANCFIIISDCDQFINFFSSVVTLWPTSSKAISKIFSIFETWEKFQCLSFKIFENFPLSNHVWGRVYMEWGKLRFFTQDTLKKIH